MESLFQWSLSAEKKQAVRGDCSTNGLRGFRAAMDFHRSAESELVEEIALPLGDF